MIRRVLLAVIAAALVVGMSGTGAHAATKKVEDTYNDTWVEPTTDIQWVKITNAKKRITVKVKVAKIRQGYHGVTVGIDPGKRGGRGFSATGYQDWSGAKFDTTMFKGRNATRLGNDPVTEVKCKGLKVKASKRLKIIKVTVPAKCAPTKAKASHFGVFLYEPMEGGFLDELTPIKVKRG